MVITAQNKLHLSAQKTFLASAVNAGDTVYPVKNTSGFNNQYAIQVGEVGQDTSEVLIASVTNAGSLSISACNYPHPADTPIYNIKYDQIVFERSTVGTVGTATPLTNGTVTLQVDNANTLFDDTSGTVGYAYRTYYRNSSLGLNTTESDWITPSGYTFYSLYSIRERIKNKLWSSSYVTDQIVDSWINEWKDEMTNAVISINQNFAMGTENVAFGTSGYGTITTADFSQLRRVWVTYDGLNSYRSTKSNPSDFLPSQVFSSTHPYHVFHGNDVIQILPGAVGTAQLEFYRFGTTMTNDSDDLPLPFRSYTKSFVDYGLAQAYLKDNKMDQYDRLMAQADKSKREFVTQSSPRDKSSNTTVRVVEPVGGDDWSFY